MPELNPVVSDPLFQESILFDGPSRRLRLVRCILQGMRRSFGDDLYHRSSR